MCILDRILRSRPAEQEEFNNNDSNIYVPVNLPFFTCHLLLAVSLLGPTLSGDKYQLMIRLSNIFLGAVKSWNMNIGVGDLRGNGKESESFVLLLKSATCYNLVDKRIYNFGTQKERSSCGRRYN